MEETHPHVTADEIREMDRMAIQDFGVPGASLMENAGAGAAAWIRRTLPEGARKIAVLAGKGNNGGDGYVVARHLMNRGFEIFCATTGDLDDVDPATDAGGNLFTLLKMELLVREIRGDEDVATILDALAGVDLVVDGLLGTGARGRVREPYAALIEGVNRLEAPVFALDVPSGLDADTGEVRGACIRAAHTATFALPKIGFTRNRGPEMCGEVHVVDIGMPRVIVDRVLARMRDGGGEAG